MAHSDHPRSPRRRQRRGGRGDPGDGRRLRRPRGDAGAGRSRRLRRHGLGRLASAAPSDPSGRSAQGNLLGEGSTSTAWDLPIEYAVAGAIPAPTLAIGGDWTMAVLGVRQDFRMEVFREGVISDDTGKVIRNLMQEDTSAVRCTARYG